MTAPATVITPAATPAATATTAATVTSALTPAQQTGIDGAGTAAKALGTGINAGLGAKALEANSARKMQAMEDASRLDSLKGRFAQDLADIKAKQIGDPLLSKAESIDSATTAVSAWQSRVTGERGGRFGGNPKV